MKTKPFYLVIDTTGRQPRADRVRASWPILEPGEVLVRLALEIPDEVIPQIQEIQIEDLDALGVAVDPVVL